MLRPLLLVLALASTLAHAKRPSRLPVNILTTNFENLFDSTHDRGKTDYTYLPLAVKRAWPRAMAWCESQTGFYREECLTLDWTPERVNRKVARIAEVLKGAMAPGLPDVVVVQEVENRRVLARVARALGPEYRAVLIEGPDERGIDTGVITRLRVLRQRLHPITTPSGEKTRGILEVDLAVGSKRMTVLANHWPSQSNPDVDRMAAGSKLLEVARAAERRSSLVIAAGDFNTAADDELDALESLILPAFWDVEAEAVRTGVDLGALATYSYRGVWASLDHIFIMKSRPYDAADYASAFIYTEQGRMIEEYEYRGVRETRPIRYNMMEGTGYSDHLPMGLTLRL